MSRVWQEVWECPRCGVQMAMGDRVDVASVSLGAPPLCDFGHGATEMEQKLAAAMPFTPDEVEDV